MSSTPSDNCIFDNLCLFAAEFEEPKIGLSGKGLKYGLFGARYLTIYSNRSVKYEDAA